MIFRVFLTTMTAASEALQILNGRLRVSRLEVGRNSPDLADEIIDLLSGPVDGEWLLRDLWSLSVDCPCWGRTLVKMIRARQLAARSAAARSQFSGTRNQSVAPAKITRVTVSRNGGRGHREALKVVEKLVGAGTRII